MSDIILHHYKTSPYSEKIRIALGLKNLSWHSVDIPVIMPKPDLVALTGGYRKTPVMQIGADIYCDTACILRVLDQRYPIPNFFPTPEVEALANWADSKMFVHAVRIVFAMLGDKVPQDFLEDRTKLTGRPFDPAQMKKALPYSISQLRSALVVWDRMLSDGRTFLMGSEATALDVSAYHPLWYMVAQLGKPIFPLTEFDRILAWMDRVKAIGHGNPIELNSAEALQISSNSSPMDSDVPNDIDPGGLKLNDKVSVTPDDIGRDPTTGEIVSSNAQEIVIRRTDPRAGTVHVHFPCMGFIVRPEK